jgi:hypothetical protein
VAEPLGLSAQLEPMEEKAPMAWKAPMELKAWMELKVWMEGMELRVLSGSMEQPEQPDRWEDPFAHYRCSKQGQCK